MLVLLRFVQGRGSGWWLTTRAPDGCNFLNRNGFSLERRLSFYEIIPNVSRVRERV
jgi:hypothetical protein